ncbi:MAG: sigma-70 family RNA polymerase sigma factor [Planctomycetota bacterium]|nr:sigma-70 family RNA polymerase sigma factor [Planctomycetota bacterium]MDA1214220.1 sigma-70 family RNA polymerase sigma factor [Planctomycetota bacterium]
MEVGERDDDQLMISVQSGDAEAFEELVQRYQGPLWAFFFRNSRDAQFSEDLTQETLLRLHNQSWDYLPRGRFRGWLFRIGRNLMIDNIRKQSHDILIHAQKGTKDEQSPLIDLISDDMLGSHDQAQAHELEALVNELLDQIPEEQRLTFTLHHFGGLSLPEIAEAMETNVATCKSRLRLTREKLQAALKKRGWNPLAVNVAESDDNDQETFA